jgi:hypothetical protein
MKPEVLQRVSGHDGITAQNKLPSIRSIIEDSEMIAISRDRSHL